MIGSLVGGHIRILGVLGQGGMGDVYAGVDERLGRKVAVKTIRADRSTAARERFLREARTLSALDHPNICRLYEYVESPEGDFLVLELIEGTTLGRAIERGLSRPRKLRIAADILAALVAAHRKGIVHRDLKPDNVMLTTEGAVKVLDFGIAHLVESEEITTLAGGTVTPVEDDATLIYPIAGVALRPEARGVIAGTPIYMSPEQAVGGDITPASDLYSFGLLLQTLLTEEPAHDKSLRREVLLQKAARGESRPMTGQPHDVTALVTSLKTLAPAERPAAAEALTAIQRIIDKPKRRIRYAAAMIALALLLGGAAKYLLDVTAARQEAVRRRSQAEDLVRFMVGDLRKKLEPVGRLDVLDGAASRALAYYASLSPEEMTGEDLDQSSTALSQLGQARMKEGKLPQAIALLRQSVRFASAGVQRNGSSEEPELTLSNAHFYLGDALRRSGDVQGTLENFRAYYGISQKLARHHPDDPKYQAEVSYSHGNLGAAYELAGDLPKALAEYRTAYELDRARMERFPKDEQWQSDLANSANRLGVVLNKSGDFSGARAAFDEDLQMRRRLALAAPNDTRRQQRLAVSLSYAGWLHQQTGDDPQALLCFREEAELSTALAARDRSNTEARVYRDRANSRFASLLEPHEGSVLAATASKDLEDVVHKDARLEWRTNLASALMRQTWIYLKLEDTAQARKTSAEALSASEALVAERPKDRECVLALCETLLATAEMDEADGHRSLSRARRERVAAMSGMTPDPRLTALQVRALIALGRDDEAAPLAVKLSAGGYREREFLSVAGRLKSMHSPPVGSEP
jgi:serine/threonine-protein kinase